MKYYHIGWSHCGCSSLEQAFNQIAAWHPYLGLKIIRFGEPIIAAEGMRLRDLLKFNRDNSRQPLHGLDEYNVIIEPQADHYSDDIPVWRYIAGNLDDVKFILTVREPMGAALSHYKHMSGGGDMRFKTMLEYGQIAKSLYEIQYTQTKYVDLIKDYFSDDPQRLLVMDISSGDGYEKLLPFLGLDVPDNLPQFPHINQHSFDQISVRL